MTRKRKAIAVLCYFAFLALLVSGTTGIAVADDTKDFVAIRKFLNSHCSKCHNAKKGKGGINLTELSGFRSENAELWQEVLDNLQRGDMPPEDADQPGVAERRAFSNAVRRRLDRLVVDSGSRDFRFARLTNKQIAWSLKDILKIARDFSRDLIGDPVGKHGGSLQSTLELSSSHMEVYLGVLQKAVVEAIPDLDNPPVPYRVNGNDWEKQHYLSRNDLAHGARRHHKRYRGPRWLEDDFGIPLPPNHFFRIYIDDNRPSGQFRVRLHLRNEPPLNGGELREYEFTVFMDKGFKSSMHAIESLTVKAKPGTQIFEVFGNVCDYPGVDPAPLRADEEPYGVTAHFKYRYITVQNCSPLNSPADQPVANKEWIIHGDGHYVRADDQWIDAWGEEFGKTNWLKRSHRGAQHHTLGKPSVYREVMKDIGHVVIERIEFDLPWQWPPASASPFLDNGKLTDKTITSGVRAVAQQAWRRPLAGGESQSLDALVANKLRSSASKADALRDLLTTVFADSRFLFYSDVEKTVRLRNHELVSRLAGFLWRSVPDDELKDLAAKDVMLSDIDLLAQVDRMIADPRSDRFVLDFTAVWLAFSKLEQVAVNPNYYGWWNPHFKHYLKQESVAFLSTLLRDNLSCLNCLSSDFIVVNDMMAKFYGIPKPASGHRFSRVPAPNDRGGILTQAAFLLAHSTGEDSHTVHRGVWLRSRILGDPPRDPPPAVPALDELDIPDAPRHSTKERLALHRTGVCYDCHKDIDPWGVAMEAYDATGKVREKILRILPDGNKRLQLPVVAHAEIRGKSIAGMDDLKKLLRESCAAEFAQGFSASMLSFALGRPLTYHEDEIVKSITTRFQESGHRMAELIKAIVVHPEFRHPNRRSAPSTAQIP
jgi:hypothetical protein